MYQSPDFIKVDLEIKDSFAAYSTCYRNSYIVKTNNETVVPVGICQNDDISQYASSETDYTCFLGKNSY